MNPVSADAVIIQVGDQRVACSATVLQWKSEYFAILLDYDIDSTRIFEMEQDMPVFVVDDVSAVCSPVKAAAFLHLINKRTTWHCMDWDADFAALSVKWIMPQYIHFYKHLIRSGLCVSDDGWDTTNTYRLSHVLTNLSTHTHNMNILMGCEISLQAREDALPKTGKIIRIKQLRQGEIQVCMANDHFTDISRVDMARYPLSRVTIPGVIFPFVRPQDIDTFWGMVRMLREYECYSDVIEKERVVELLQANPQLLCMMGMFPTSKMEDASLGGSRTE